VFEWFAIGMAILIVLAIIANRLTRRGTIYLTRRWGFTSVGGRKSIHCTNEDGFREVIQRLLPGDLFDMLWVSWCDDKYSGIMLTVESGSPELSITFKTGSEQAELKSFKEAMAQFGYSLEEDSDSFNGGMAEEHRITSLEYSLPGETDAILKAADTALTNLHGSPPESYVMSGSLFAHGPGFGSGIKFFADEDPLNQILGHS